VTTTIVLDRDELVELLATIDALEELLATLNENVDGPAADRLALLVGRHFDRHFYNGERDDDERYNALFDEIIHARSYPIVASMLEQMLDDPDEHCGLGVLFDDDDRPAAWPYVRRELRDQMRLYRRQPHELSAAAGG